MAAAYPPSASSSSSHTHRGATYRSPPAAILSNAPQGTFLPGTKVQVGSHRVIIEKYLSEGGFAHVYVVRIPRDGNKYELAVLKRVAVPDKEHLASMRTEVETMKKLKGHKHIVTYIDSHASQLKGEGYEVFLLMEFCEGAGLIDFMNTRLQHRLTEPEILKIFGDVAEGVACMHYLKPPLLHRDLKVENVLISTTGGRDSVPVYKLCDFGSTAPPRPAATTAEEGRLIEEDVQKHTTMQYRSPEMIDVWRKRPIDEKADIWALGVLLYKLCYYTTPFEEVGQMAILNANFKYPAYPQFSEKVKKLIGWMLKEDPRHRPNIYQVIKEVCSMRGAKVPIKDIYAERTHSEARRNESLPSPVSNVASPPPPTIGLQKAAPQVDSQIIPTIAPMRRGRPTAASSNPAKSAQPSPSPARGDPFAALDSKNFEARAGAIDELAKRFPSLDEFSIAHEKPGAFQFGTKPQSAASSSAPKEAHGALSDRVTRALADEVFAVSKSTKADLPKSKSTTQIQEAGTSPPKSRAPIRSQSRPLQAEPINDEGRYKSTGTGSSPPSLSAKPLRHASIPQAETKLPEVNKRAIWRVPSEKDRTSSLPRSSKDAKTAAALLQPSLPSSQRPALLQQVHRSKSQTATVSTEGDRSSWDADFGHGNAGADDNTLLRTRSSQHYSRPSSAYLSSNLDFLRDQEGSRKTSTEVRRSMEVRRQSRQSSPRLVAVDDGDFSSTDDRNIDNDMDFLHSKEEEDSTDPKRRHSRKGSQGLGHIKRSSLPSISGATKEIFKGRFSDAFKRFEATSSKDDSDKTAQEAGTRTPAPLDDEQEQAMLSPIAGSEATHSEKGESLADSTEDLPPDVKREMERRRLSQEERRVAEAAKEYRARVASNGTGGGGQTQQSNRASTIQRRVQTLLDEGTRSTSPVKRTAEGYGRFTETAAAAAENGGRGEQETLPPRTSSLKQGPPPMIAKKPFTQLPEPGVQLQAQSYQRTRAPQTSATVPTSTSTVISPQMSTSPDIQQGSIQQPQRNISRPSAPPKPKVLRTAQWPPSPLDTFTDKPLPAQPSGNLAALLAKDLEGVPDYPTRESANATNPAGVDADEVEDFSRRYPSLSGIEMVETEIGADGSAPKLGRMKEI